MKPRKYRILLICFMNEVGKEPERGFSNMCQTLNNERDRGGYRNHPQTQKVKRDCFIRAVSG